MRTRGLPLLLVILLGACTSAGTRTVRVDPAELAIINLNVVDLDRGRILSGRTVLVSGTRIAAVGIGSEIAPSSGARVVDGDGAYMIPGLIDAHVHLFNNVSSRPPNTWAFPLFVAAGVTGVREMWIEPDQMKTVASWRRAVSGGRGIGPRVLAAGALVDGPRSWLATAPQVATPDDARRFVREAVQAGANFVKVYSLLNPAAYRAIADESSRLGIEFSGHIPLRVHALESAQLGQRTNEHLHQIREACSRVEAQIIQERLQFYVGGMRSEDEDSLLDHQLHRATAGFDGQACNPIALALARSGQGQVPTLVNERRWFLGAPSGAARDESLALVPAAERERWVQAVERGSLATYSGHPEALEAGWSATLRLVEILHQAGVEILAGTDFGNPFIVPGFSLHEELAVFVDAGLTSLEALRAATVIPARVLGADSLASIAPGQVADLVLLDANPLANIHNIERIRGVILAGRYLSRDDLDDLLARAAVAGKR